MDNGKNPHNVSIASSAAAIDAIVLGTVNAPYKRSISAEQLADALASGKPAAWLVHVATFFTDVRPALIIDFAAAHDVPHPELVAAYAAVRQASGERNLSLETTLVALAQAA